MTKMQKRLWLIYFSLLFFWGAQAYCLLATLYQKHELFAFTKDGLPYVSDFINVYSAGVLCAQNIVSPINIYDAQVQATLQNKLVAPVVPESPFYNQYPPLMFLTFLPLSLWSMPHAWIAWSLFSWLFISCALYLAVLPNYKSWIEKLVAYTAIMAGYPTWISFRLGQTSLFLMPVVVILFHLLAQGRFFLSGLTASLVFLKLQYVPIVAAVGFACGRWHFLKGFALGSTVLAVASFIAVGRDNFLAFPQALVSGESGANGSGVAPEMMQNLRGLLVLAMGQDNRTVHIVAAAALLVSILFLFILWWKQGFDQTANRENREEFNFKFNLLYGLTLLLMLSLSVHTHSQDYILCMAAFEVLWRTLSRSSQSSKTKSVSQLSAATALSFSILKKMSLFFPLVSWLLFLLMPFLQIVKIQPFAVYAMLAALLTLIVGKRVLSMK